jgi:hypothetical protein
VTGDGPLVSEVLAKMPAADRGRKSSWTIASAASHPPSGKQASSRGPAEVRGYVVTGPRTEHRYARPAQRIGAVVDPPAGQGRRP